jgi:putative sigma-54 modulation protein
MRKNIKATNIELTPDISDHLDKQLKSIEKLTDSNDTSIMCDIEVGKTTRHHQHGDVFRAEINLHIAGKQLRATAEEETLYNAIDRVISEITRELRRFKGKRKRLLRRSGAKMKELIAALSSRSIRVKNILRKKKRY